MNNDEYIAEGLSILHSHIFFLQYPEIYFFQTSLMQKLLIRIVLAILLAFFLFFSYSAYHYYVALHSDDPIIPYVLVEEGKATVVRGELAIDMVGGDRYDLSEKDIIITAKDTFAIVTWPDKSQTRLGASSRMQIDRMQVARDYSSIEVEFALEEGQVWTTVVRTIYPGSYFRTRIPGQGVIAGVRGTVYDIDLVRGYIRSIDHSVTLTDRYDNTLSLLPGEIASVRDILTKLTQDVVDASWNTVNQLRDVTFLSERSRLLQEQVDVLSGKSWGLWDRFVRWILSFVPTFDDLALLQSLVGDIPWLENIEIPREQFMRVYQKLQDTKFVQERDTLRSYIAGHSGSLGFSTDDMETFLRGAVWDSLSSSGMTLDGAQALFQDYSANLSTQVQWVLRVVPLRDLESRAQETLRQLVK